jgi:hypothetical protein
LIENKAGVVDSYPNIKKVYESVKSNPKISAYLKSDRRQKSQFH